MSNKDTKISPVQLINSIYSIVLWFLPGGHVVQEISEFHGKIRQERINRFSELFKEALEQIYGQEIDSEKMVTEILLMRLN